MLRAILTAHVSPLDRNLLSLQLNQLLLGKAASDHKSNFVMTGNREVHLLLGFYTEGGNPAEMQELREKIQLWEDVFKELQLGGLGLLTQILEENRPEADSLMIAGASIILIWQDRQKGVYLQRQGKLFRLQPCARPPELFPKNWMEYGDFYALTPLPQDLILMMSPDFVAQFKAEQLEEMFSQPRQLSALMSELTQLGKTYGYNLEQSWLGVQIQRTEENSIFKRSGLPSGDGCEIFRGLPRSRASRVRYGQKLIPAPAVDSGQTRRTEEKKTPQSAAKHRPALGGRKLRKEEEKQAIEPFNSRQRQERAENLKAYEQRREAKERFLDRLRDFSFEPLLGKIRGAARRFFSLWPDRPLISGIFAMLLILLCVLLMILFARGRQQPEQRRVLQPYTTATEETRTDLSASQPLTTDLEIPIIVKANNLQMRQAPDASSALLATVKRGERVLQLAPEQGGWVYVRGASGVEGYVFGEYLLNQP